MSSKLSGTSAACSARRWKSLEHRLARLLRFYRTRAERLARALRQHAPFWQFEMPAGGFSIWVETATMLPERDYLRLAVEEGVSFDPGSAFRPDASATPLAFRLCYSRANPPSWSRA